MMYGYDAGSWAGPGGWLMMLGVMALVVGLVLVVAWAVGRAAGHASAPATPTAWNPQAMASAGEALEVLRTRFARGEITADEYRAAKQVLEAE